MAALFVFFSHYVGLFNPSLSIIEHLRSTPLGVLINGHAAVMFFFTLSGFVLAAPHLDNERPVRLLEFYVKRIFRIYPAYIATITIAVVCRYLLFDHARLEHFSPWINSLWHGSWSWQSFEEIIKTYALIAPSFDNNFIDPVVWSLVIEMRMCFLLPALIWLATRTGARFYIGSAVILSLAGIDGLPHYAAIFYLGVLLARYRQPLQPAVQKLPGYLLFLLTVAALWLYNSNFEYFNIDPTPGEPLFRYSLRDFVMAVGSAILIIIVISKGHHTKILERKPFLTLGEISYSFYLLHLPIMLLTCSLFSYTSAWSYVYILIATLMPTVLLSIWMYDHIEIPFQKMAKRLTGRVSVHWRLSS